MPKKILIIDDEPPIIAALSVRLKKSGYTTHSAQNGHAGLKAAENCRPDVIVLDIRMPDMDGFEVCRRLKETDDLSQIPVIFLSANIKDEAKANAKASGGSRFISKPYDAEKLVAAIDDVLTPSVTPT